VQSERERTECEGRKQSREAWHTGWIMLWRMRREQSESARGAMMLVRGRAR
jgi:hypothetical protein